MLEVEVVLYARVYGVVGVGGCTDVLYVGYWEILGCPILSLHL